jgi:hypothetical protein
MLRVIFFLIVAFFSAINIITLTGPAKAPRRSPGRWGGFVHLLARRYQNYQAALLKAARRKKRRSIDIDVQKSKSGTLWAFHWPTVGKNKLHDPLGKIHKNAQIDQLTDEQIERLRGPNGQKPNRLRGLLIMAAERGVRVEAETKSVVPLLEVKKLMAVAEIAEMVEQGLLQAKTLAFMGYKHNKNAAAARLKPWHEAGVPTILSFTDFGRRRGIDKSVAWPVTDYVRGRAKWVA